MNWSVSAKVLNMTQCIADLRFMHDYHATFALTKICSGPAL
jgi:hypothetical protein